MTPRPVTVAQAADRPVPHEHIAIPVTAAVSAVDGRRRGGVPFDELDLWSAWVDNGPSPADNPGPYLKAVRLDPADRSKLHPDETTHRIYSRRWVGDKHAGRKISAVWAERREGQWYWVYQVRV